MYLLKTRKETEDKQRNQEWRIKRSTNNGLSPASLETIEFENGTAWDFAAVKTMLPPVGTEGDDQVRGYNTAEVIDGLGGNDGIEGQGGDDTVKGGAGNDTAAFMADDACYLKAA